MGIFSHVRLQFWDPERYTDAQAMELEGVRRLFMQNLAPVFGQEYPAALCLRKDNTHYPAYAITTRADVPIAITRKSGNQPLKPFTHGLLSTLKVYQRRREQRFFGKGHANDPAHLLLIYLNDIFSTWLASALVNITSVRHSF